MDNLSTSSQKQRPVARCVSDTLGTTPAWIWTEGLTRGAILPTSRTLDSDSLRVPSSSIDRENQE